MHPQVCRTSLDKCGLSLTRGMLRQKVHLQSWGQEISLPGAKLRTAKLSFEAHPPVLPCMAISPILRRARRPPRKTLEASSSRAAYENPGNYRPQRWISIYVSIDLSIRLNIYLSIHLYVYLSVYMYKWQRTCLCLHVIIIQRCLEGNLPLRNLNA